MALRAPMFGGENTQIGGSRISCVGVVATEESLEILLSRLKELHSNYFTKGLSIPSCRRERFWFIPFLLLIRVFLFFKIELFFGKKELILSSFALERHLFIMMPLHKRDLSHKFFF